MPPRTGLRVGLLGGSFNPAHRGHRHISLIALARLRLDAVWWLVSPQNPLKPAAGMAPYGERVAGARALATHPRIHVSSAEAGMGTLRTVDTLARLLPMFPRHRFVWLMGADNLAEIDRWHRWPAIFAALPVAVFDRPAYAATAIGSRAAHRYQKYRVAAAKAHALADRPPPAWTFVRMPRDATAASEIRRRTLSRAPPPRRSGIPSAHR